VAEILDVESVKGADKLYKLKIDVGGSEKQIVAGIAEQYSADELMGKKIVVVDNLESAVIRGEKSEGMLLAAMDGEIISIITPDKEMPPGASIK
jgi:methionyl-tRNA synthetase